MEPKYTLKLDAAWQPIEIITVFRGFNMVYKGRAKMIEGYDTGPVPNHVYPSVIVLHSYVSKRRFQLSLNRKNIIWRDKYICQYCGNRFPYHDLTMDHIIPQCKGGEDSWTNLVACCKGCNSDKGFKSLKEFGKKPLTNPKKPAITIRDYYRNIPILDSWNNYM